MDDQEFVVAQEVHRRDTRLRSPAQRIRCSKTILDMLEDMGDTDVTIPLPNISGAILAKIIDYTAHQDDKPWLATFCDVDQSTLFALVLAANYLHIEPLLDLTCTTVANMIKGKTTEEIRATFNITNDFTPEEEEQVRKENEWCEER